MEEVFYRLAEHRISETDHWKASACGRNLEELASMSNCRFDCIACFVLLLCLNTSDLSTVNIKFNFYLNISVQFQ